jgi:DNA mismatch repair protein MutS2
MSKFKYALGEIVKIKSLKKIGKITKISKNKAYISIENIEICCKIDDIETTTNHNTHKEVRKIQILSTAKGNPKYSLDLHGLTASQALNSIETFINDAVLNNLTRIEIIHGHGSGVLLKTTHNYLLTLNFVRKYEISPFNTGTTVVYLNSKIYT